MKRPLLIVAELVLGAVVLAMAINLITDQIEVPLVVALALGGAALLGLIPIALQLHLQPRGWFQGMEPIRSVTPGHIVSRLGRGGQVNWVDRHASSVADLRAHGRIVITGRMQLGKTREAAELIRRAHHEEIVLTNRTYEPTPAIRYLVGESLCLALRRCLDPQTAALLFVDDLPYHYSDRALEQLSAALDLFQECKASYVVATARTDQLTEEHRKWLELQNFHIIRLPDLDEAQSSSLIESAVDTFQLNMDKGARVEFVDGRDGTPELVLASLRRLQAEGVKHVDQEIARSMARRSLLEQWAELRRYVQERNEITRPLLRALATFHATGEPAHLPLALHYATYLWKRGHGWYWPCLTMSRFRGALTYLSHFDFIVQRGVVSYPDVALEGLLDPEAARESLGAFLLDHRKILGHRWLRRLYRDAESHTSALFHLGIQYQERAEHDIAVGFYNAALRLRPTMWLYHNRGTAYAELGNWSLAVADFDQAIALYPRFAKTYSNRGFARIQLGDLEGAFVDFEQAIALDPRFAEAYIGRGAAHKEQGDFIGALVDYDHAIELAPQSDAAYNNRGIARHAQGNLEGALADYGRAVALNPRSAPVYQNRGITHYTMGNHEAAIADFEQAIALDPRHADNYTNRGNVRRAQGDLEGAIADYTQAITLDSLSSNAYYNRGVAYSDLGELDRSLVDYDRAIELDPRHAVSYHNRGNARKDQGDLKGAIADYTQAITLDPPFRDAYCNRGAVYSDLGKLDRSLADYDRAIELDPRHADSYSNRGNVRKAQGDLEGAIADYTRAITLDPQNATPHYNQGIARYLKGDLEGAAADYNRAIELNPKHTEAYCNRGNIRLVEGKVEEAIADYDRAIELDPRHAFSYTNRGNARKAQGDLKGAIADYTQAIILDPLLTDAYCNRGAAYSDLGELDRSLVDYDRAIELDPRHAASYHNRGNARKDQGDLKGAIADYTQAITLDPLLADAYYSRARAHHARGTLGPAIVDYSRATELNPQDPSAHFALGAVLADAGQLRESLPHFKKAAQLGDAQATQAISIVQEMMGVEPMPQADPAQEAFEAFQRAGSVEAMQQAVARFPLLTQIDFITAIEQAINQQVQPEHRPAFERRLLWLRQLTHDGE